MEKIYEDHKLELTAETNEEENEHKLECDENEDKEAKLELNEEQHSAMMACD